jgi:hypothetical protein
VDPGGEERVAGSSAPWAACFFPDDHATKLTGLNSAL